MPLTDEQREQIRSQIEQAEGMIPGAEKDLRDAMKAGIDVTAQQERLAETKTRIKKLKTVYGR